MIVSLSGCDTKSFAKLALTTSACRVCGAEIVGRAFETIYSTSLCCDFWVSTLVNLNPKPYLTRVGSSLPCLALS